jgi:hypothetical protein
MRIVKSKEPKEVLIDTLNVGDCIIFKDDLDDEDMLYMIAQHNDSGKLYIVCLSDGAIYDYNGTEKVIEVKAKVVIE